MVFWAACLVALQPGHEGPQELQQGLKLLLVEFLLQDRARRTRTGVPGGMYF